MRGGSRASEGIEERHENEGGMRWTDFVGRDVMGIIVAAIKWVEIVVQFTHVDSTWVLMGSELALERCSGSAYDRFGLSHAVGG